MSRPLSATRSAQQAKIVKVRRLGATRPLELTIIYLLLCLSAAFLLLPLMWAIAASFSPNEKVFEYAYPFSWRALLPAEFTLEAYQALFARGFGRTILNTLILGLITVFVGGFVNALAGFAFARFQFWGKNFIFIAVVMTSFLVPVDLTVIPRYILVKDFGWVNTWQGLIIPGLASSLVIYLFRQFFAELPQELIDAARVDGATYFQLFLRVILPISKPALLTAALLLFLSQWDSFFWPLVVASDPKLQVVQVAISQAVGQYQTQWNQLLAGSMLAAIIPILLVLPFQSYYVRGITGAGLKE
jgi:multiple sugar transport system permease protein